MSNNRIKKFGIIYGAIVAIVQIDIKKLIAYSSISHMGFVMLGISAGRYLSLEGAVIQMINHGITSGALFMLVGFLYDRRHTRRISDFGGLKKSMPLYAGIFLFTSFASISWMAVSLTMTGSMCRPLLLLSNLCRLTPGATPLLWLL